MLPFYLSSALLRSVQLSLRLTIAFSFFHSEFFYIQMEKHSRQALSEGVKSAEELTVTADCELVRVINMHYNRNNHIEVRNVSLLLQL